MASILDDLKHDEGFSPHPYTDRGGALTIGYGRNLTAVGISKDEAEALLRNDVIRRVFVLSAELPWTAGLDDARHAVLIEMAYNLGMQGLLGFTRMLAAAEAGDWTTAAAEMRASAWAGQVGARATRLAAQMETGQWRPRG